MIISWTNLSCLAFQLYWIILYLDLKLFFILVASDGLYWYLNNQLLQNAHILLIFSLHLSMPSCFDNHLMEIFCLQLSFLFCTSIPFHLRLSCPIPIIAASSNTNVLFCTVLSSSRQLRENFCDSTKEWCEPGIWTHDLLVSSRLQTSKTTMPWPGLLTNSKKSGCILPL